MQFLSKHWLARQKLNVGTGKKVLFFWQHFRHYVPPTGPQLKDLRWVFRGRLINFHANRLYLLAQRENSQISIRIVDWVPLHFSSFVYYAIHQLHRVKSTDKMHRMGRKNVDRCRLHSRVRNQWKVFCQVQAVLLIRKSKTDYYYRANLTRSWVHRYSV